MLSRMGTLTYLIRSGRMHFKRVTRLHPRLVALAAPNRPRVYLRKGNYAMSRNESAKTSGIVPQNMQLTRTYPEELCLQSTPTSRGPTRSMTGSNLVTGRTRSRVRLRHIRPEHTRRDGTGDQMHRPPRTGIRGQNALLKMNGRRR